jgi:hypothetical protein
MLLSSVDGHHIRAIRDRRSAHSLHAIPCRPAPSATRRSSCIDGVCISKPGKAGADGQFAHGRWENIRRAAGPNQTEAARAISALPASLFRKATHQRQSNAAMSYRCVKAGSTIVLDFLSTCLIGCAVLSATGSIKTARLGTGATNLGESFAELHVRGAWEIHAKSEPRLRDVWAMSR